MILITDVADSLPLDKLGAFSVLLIVMTGMLMFFCWKMYNKDK